MSQVPATNNETFKAPEPSNIQRNDDVFSNILEKEKIKTVPPSMIPVNFQSFFNFPLFSSPGAGTETNRIENSAALQSDRYQPPVMANETGNKPHIEEQKKERADSVTDIAKQAKADQVRDSANMNNRTFVGELELSPDLYSALITAKNNSALLRSVDVDDLIAQIKNKIKFLVENGKTELTIELKPENLGTLLMSVSNNKGVLSINIFADQAAKQALEENIAELERSLKLADLNISDLNILSNERKGHNKG